MFPPLKDPDLHGRVLSDLDLRILAALSRCPFASAADLSVWLDVTQSRAHRRLQGLVGRSLVSSSPFYVGARQHQRYWLCSDLGSPAHPGRMRLHPPHHLGRLAQNIPFVAAVYETCSTIVRSGGGDLLDLHWPVETPYDCAARFTGGWVVFYWAGLWQVGARLLRRLADSVHHFPLVSPESDAHHWPARLCFVACDAWQGRLVSDAVDSLGLADRLFVRLVDGDESYGDLLPVESPGWIDPAPGPVVPRPFNVSAAVGRTRHARPSGNLDGTVALALEQWPGQPVSVLSSLAGTHVSRTSQAVARLVAEGSAWQDSGGGYSPTDRWLRRAAARDRAGRAFAIRHSGERPVRDRIVGRHRTHERGLAHLMARLRSSGCPVAVGWRGAERHGRDGSVDPDGLVYLDRSPLGSTWFYVEYERRAVAPSRVAHKLRFLHNVAFDSRYPVIIVCRPEALRNFLDFSRDLPVLVASTRDVQSGALLGEGPTVWRYGGEPVHGLA